MYAEFYGLVRPPFEMTPDPAFLYLGETPPRRARDAALRRAGREGLRAAHRRGRHRQDHAAARAARPAGCEHRLGLPVQPQAGSARLLPGALRRARDPEALPFQGGVPARPESLPDRATGAQPDDAADHRRGAEPLARDAGRSAAALEPRDPLEEAAADHAGGAAGAERDAGAPRAAPAPPADRAATPPAALRSRRSSTSTSPSGSRLRDTRGRASSSARPGGRSTR